MYMRREIRYLPVQILVLLIINRVGLSQGVSPDSTQSIILRHYTPPLSAELIRPSQTEYRLWEGFMLVRKANDGDPAAEHELGLRYFLGEGFPIDTLRAAYWIKRAAEQKMPIAEYNFGVFLNNGWGISWNPFKAFGEFDNAAGQHLPEAELALGLMYTDNLVVPRNLSRAYRLVKEAADAKYPPARRVLKIFVEQGVTDSTDTTSEVSTEGDTASNVNSSGFEPVFLNFNRDSITDVNDSTIIEEAYRKGGAILMSAFPAKGLSAISQAGRPGTIKIVERAANLGDPQALTILGRCYQKGVGVHRDDILAAEQYLRAARLDSRQALVLLLKLVRRKSFDAEVESRTKAGDTDAAFVWAGLTELGLDHRVDGHQAFKLLSAAAAEGNIPSLLELGRCYYTGEWTSINPMLGKQCWMQAANEGSSEARVRLAATVVLADSASSDSGVLIARDAALSDTIHTLLDASAEGSIIAQLAIGYCYEYGIGLPRDTADAVRVYRQCADRGSSSAYEALRKMYDRIRPKTPKFQIKGRGYG